MKIVVKFGGSSLASAEQFKKVADIIHADPHRRFVVPSAPGKRFDGDTKGTDMLYGCYDLAEAGKDFDGALADIKARYDEIIEGLGLDLTLDKEFETIHEQFRLKAGRNYAASRGEYLNGIVLANYLGFEFVDAATVIRFDDAGNFEADRTDLILSSRLKDVEYAVVPGFYGAQDYPRRTLHAQDHGGKSWHASRLGACHGRESRIFLGNPGKNIRPSATI